jgi:hypothetical protein
MAGYANRIITISFPELSDDPKERIWVTIRNPKLVPIDEMRGGTGNIQLDANGEPVDSDEAVSAGYGVLAKLVVGWHVWDATVVPVLDAAGNDVSVQVLLPQAPVTAGTIAKLPSVIQNRLMGEVAGVNPQQTPASQEVTGTPS